MKVQRLLVAAPVLAASLILAACSSGGSDNSGAPDPDDWRENITGSEIEVGVLPAKGTPGLEYLQKMAEDIEKEYDGAEIKLVFANSEARPSLEQRWRAGDGLDVDYGMFNGMAPAQLEWARDGALLDLTPYLNEENPKTGEPWLDSFIPAVSEFMTDPKNGEIYGVPTELSTHVLFYNAGMFDKLGITPPKTWPEFLAACDQLKAAGVAPISVTGLFQPYMGMWSDYLWLRTVGWEKANEVLVEGKGHITDDPGFLEGLKMLQKLRDDGDFIKGFKGTDFTPAQAEFFQGKAGMILMGSWLVGEMKDVIPADFQTGVLPFPTVPDADGDQKAMMSTAQLISINADSDNIPLALEWASRFTSKKVQTDRAQKFGELSAVKDVPSPTGVTGIDKVVAGADQLVLRQFGTEGTKQKDVIYAEITRLMFGQQDAKTTLDRLDKQLRGIFGN